MSLTGIIQSFYVRQDIKLIREEMYKYADTCYYVIVVSYESKETRKSGTFGGEMKRFGQ